MNMDAHKRVVVATGSEILREKIGGPLRDAGYQVEEAASSAEVLSQIAGLDEGVLVLGDHLSDQDALPFLAELNGKAANFRIVMIGIDRRQERDFRKCGARFFLYPPFHPEMVALKLRVMFNPEDKGQDRVRKHQRLSVKNMQVALSAPVKELVSVTDLGQGGARIRGGHLEPKYVGKLLKMELISGDRTLAINGRVIWCEDGMAGIHFAAPKPLGFQEFFDEIAQRLNKVEPGF